MKCHNENSRLLVIKIFEEVLNGNTVQNGLDRSIRAKKIPHQEIPLCTELLYGFCRQYIRINSVLCVFLKKPEKLPKKMFLLLGLAVYEILFLDKIPHYATLSYTVAKIKALFGKHMAGLANAVLRKISAKKNEILVADFYEKHSDFFSIPSWMYDNFKSAYGQETGEQILSRFLQRPKTTIRLNPLHPQFLRLREECELVDGAESIAFSGFTFLEKKPQFLLNKTLEDWHSEGAFSWQSAASQEVMFQCFNAVPSLKEKHFFDICAGQGGKSFILLEQGIPVSLASDISLQRLQQFQRTARRLHISLPPLICQSATQISSRVKDMNIILDVPCSGLGTLARRPEIRFRRTEEEMEHFVRIQSRILDNTWTHLSKHAHLIYITCTLNPAENEQQIDLFLQREASAQLIFDWQTPHSHPWLEGMYCAVLIKK